MMRSLPSHLRHWDTYWTARAESWPYAATRLLWIPAQIYFMSRVFHALSIEYDSPPLPYPFLAVAAHLPASAALTLCILGSTCILCIAVGWRTRAAQAVFAVTAALLFFRSASLYHNHLVVFLIVNTLIACAATERWHALDANRMRRRLSATAFKQWQEEPVSLLPGRLILLQGSMLYLFAGLQKIESQWFYRWAGTTEPLLYMRDGIWRATWQALLDRNLAWLPLTAVIAMMFILVPGVFLARRFPSIALLGILLHWLLAEMIRDPLVCAFSWIMTCILFLSLFPTESGNPFDPASIRQSLREAMPIKRKRHTS